MTIKQMAKKYNLDYQLVYQAISFSGILVRRCKDMEYSESDMIQSCVSYICVRLDKLKAKALDLVDALERISCFSEKESQK